MMPTSDALTAVLKVFYLLQPNNFRRRCQLGGFAVHGIHIRLRWELKQCGCRANERGSCLIYQTDQNWCGVPELLTTWHPPFS